MTPQKIPLLGSSLYRTQNILEHFGNDSGVFLEKIQPCHSLPADGVVVALGIMSRVPEQAWLIVVGHVAIALLIRRKLADVGARPVGAGPAEPEETVAPT